MGTADCADGQVPGTCECNCTVPSQRGLLQKAMVASSANAAVELGPKKGVLWRNAGWAAGRNARRHMGWFYRWSAGSC